MVGLLDMEGNPEDDFVVNDTMTKWEVVFLLILSVAFFISFVQSIDIYASFEIRRSISDTLENYPYNSKGETYSDINNKDDLDMFLQNVVLQQIYNESMKYYPKVNEPHHYIHNNYIAGIRFSYQRASMKNKGSQYSDVISQTRRRNYEGSTNTSSFDFVQKQPFGRNQVKYSNKGGYYDRGGYIFYFEGNWTLQQALQYYDNLKQDDLYDQHFIALTMEIIGYNENRQTGVHMVYEFLFNNAGDISTKYKDAAMFNGSIYKKPYRQYTSFWIFCLQAIDVIYALGNLFVIIAFGKTVYKRVKEMYYTKSVYFPWYNLIDFAVIILAWTTIIYWVVIFIAPNEIQFPLRGEPAFQSVVAYCRKFTQVRSISSFQGVLLCFRMIRILTTQFPAFGCLFDTIKLSARDLISFLALMLILILGYAYAVSFCFPDGHRSIIESGNDLFFSSMTMSVYCQFLVGKGQKFIKWFFFICFIVVFNIILI